MRSLRPFLQWMGDHGIAWADGIHFKGEGEGKWGVYAGRAMEEGEAIVRISKKACLTAHNTGAAPQIEAACLGGGLALAVAVMYERSLGPLSPWHAYLAVLPPQEDLPITWGCAQVRHHLKGTELHQTVLDDIRLIRQDWQDCIAPLSEEDPATFPHAHFTLPAYLAAKTLVSSRAFAIDRTLTMAMVPFADMLNHRTAAEDVHLMTGDDDGAEEGSGTSHETEEPSVEDSGLQGESSQHVGTEDDTNSGESPERGLEKEIHRNLEGPGETGRPHLKLTGRRKRRKVGDREEEIDVRGSGCDVDMEQASKRLWRVEAKDEGQAVASGVQGQAGGVRAEAGRAPTQHECVREERRVTEELRVNEHKETANALNDGGTATKSDGDELEMVLLHDVTPGKEVFNTYGRLSNGALLHRYGFTEPHNPFDLVNLDIHHVTEAAAAPGCTPRLVRARTALWRQALSSEAKMQTCEYFEVDARGAPERELLFLLFLIHAADHVAADLSRHPQLTHCAGDVTRLARLLGYKEKEQLGVEGSGGRRQRDLACGSGGDREPGGGGSAAQPESSTRSELGAGQYVEDDEAAGEEVGGVWCPKEEPLEDWLLTSEVARTLLRVLDRREKAYGAGPLAQDETTVAALHPGLQPRAYHSVALRIAERRVLEKCRRALKRRLTLESG